MSEGGQGGMSTCRGRPKGKHRGGGGYWNISGMLPFTLTFLYWSHQGGTVDWNHVDLLITTSVRFAFYVLNNCFWNVENNNIMNLCLKALDLHAITDTHTQPSTVLNKMFHWVLLKKLCWFCTSALGLPLQMTSFTTTLLLSIPCAKGYAPYRTWTEGRLSCCSGHHRWEQCSGWTWVGGGWLPQPQRCDDCYTSDEAAPPGSRFWGVNRFSEYVTAANQILCPWTPCSATAE